MQHTLILKHFRKVGEGTECIWLVCELLKDGCILDAGKKWVWVFSCLWTRRGREMPVKLVGRTWTEESQVHGLESRQDGVRGKH